MPSLFKVLASKAGDRVFLIAIKRPTSEWYYFDDKDVALEKHPEFMRAKIWSKLLGEGQRTVPVAFSETEEAQYFVRETEQFQFKDEPLKTRMYCSNHFANNLHPTKF